MSKIVTDSQHYTDIASAIREKNGTETTYKPSEMASAIQGIQSGGADFSEVEYKLSNGYTDYSNYFYNHKQMKSIPYEILQHTNSGTNFDSMFNGCTGIKAVELFDVSNSGSFTSFFNGCTYLQIVPQFNTQNGTSFANMFTNCKVLELIPALNTAKGTAFNYMFNYCSKLATIEGVDFSLATSVSSTFNKCTELQSITINGVIKITGLSFSACSKLTYDSLMSIINALYDYVSEGTTGTYTLTLGSTNLAKLTEAEKAIATQKGWTLA